MLEVPLDLSPVCVHKSLRVTQAPAEEQLKLVPRDLDRSVCVISPLVLLPREADPVPEDRRGKRNPGRPRSSSGSKIILTLLTGVVAVYVGLPAVHVRGIGFQLLAGCLGNDGSWSRSRSRNGSRSENGSRSRDSGLQNSLKNLLQVILGVLGDTISSSGGVSNRGFVEGPASWSDNSSPDSGSKEESRGATKGVAEERLRRRRPRLWIEVILELISSKTFF